MPTMAVVDLPVDGLPLSELPSIDTGLKKAKVPQAIEVAFNGKGTLQEMLANLRQDPDNVQVSLGKKPGLFIGKKAHSLQSTYQPHAFLYKKLSEDNMLKLVARFNLKDSLAREKMSQSAELNMNDPALQQLQQSLSEAQQKKEANTTVFVTGKDRSKLPPAKSGKQALPYVKSHRAGLFSQSKGTTQSLPASPSLGGLTPIPTAPDTNSLRLDALKASLIHLLAVRAVSEKYITSSLKCQAEDLKPLLEKYGRPSRFDESKFDLSDRGYKELDVWKFPYKDQEDRQAAIDRAVTAYDRQRISTRENIWQMLLPKVERNKGKVLSRLNLHTGPIERVNTPRINVEPISTDNPHLEPNTADERNGRLAPSDASTMVRSRSQDPIKKQRLSEKDAQSKRLFSKNPKKAAEAAKVKDVRSTSKKSANEEKVNGRKSKPEGKLSQNAPPKKGLAKGDGSKIKSAEFVHDSDDDVGIEDGLATQIAPSITKGANSSTKHGSETISQTRKIGPQALSAASREKAIEAKKLATPKAKPTPGKKIIPSAAISSNPAQKARASDAVQKPVAMTRTLSHKRNNSSPVKPSPLGSSPPTNASDLENDQAHKSSKSSSSSTTPLINQRRMLDSTHKAPSRAFQKTTVDGNSDRDLKRKANDIDSDIHNHDIVTAPPVRPPSEPPAKRQHTSPESSSSLSDISGHASLLLSKKNIEYSALFKNKQAEYAASLRDISALTEPTQEQVERLHRTYQKLMAHKADIWRLAAA